MADRAPRPATACVVRLRHGRADGDVHGARGGAPPRACSGRLGRRAGRSARSAADPCHRRREAARHGRPRAPHARSRRADRRSYRRTARDGCWPSALATRATSRRSSARRPARSTPARSIRSTRSPTRATLRRAPGCTSTAHSGSGQPRPPALRHLVDGVERADSWATDAHKWLNVPYDCGIAFTAHPDVAQRLRHGASGLPDPRRRRSASSSTGTPSTRAARAASPSTPRSARSGEPASPSSSSACCEHAQPLRRAARG